MHKRSISLSIGAITCLIILLIGLIPPKSAWEHHSKRIASYRAARATSIAQTHTLQNLPRPIRVGLYENSPKIYTDANGNVAGFWPDLIIHIAAEEGWQIEWVPGTWEENLARLGSGAIDMMPDVAWSEQRDKLYIFSTQKVLTNWSRLYAHPGTEISTILDLEGKTVAGLAGSINYDGEEGIKDLASRFDIKTTFVDKSDYTEVFEAIQSGEVDAGVTNKDFGDQNEVVYDVERTPFIFQPNHIEFAFPMEGEFTAILLERIDAQIAMMKADTESAYYLALEQNLEEQTAVTIVETIPGWVMNLFLVGGGVVVFLLAVGITSRIQVRRQTAALLQSEENYRTLFEHATDGIFLADRTGQYVDVNMRGCDMLGYSRPELLSMRMANLIPAEELAARPIPIAKLLSGKQIISERTLLHKNGTKIPVEISSQLMPSGLLQGIVRDITERKQAEAERNKLAAQIREQAVQLELILETVPTGVLVLSPEEYILLANPAARQDLPALADANVGDQLTRLGDQPLHKLLTSPPEGLWHEVRTKKDVFDVVAHRVEAGPSPGHWVLVIIKVTQEREIQNQLRQQERLASVGQLAAGIAHDFNNIMTTIILYTQLLAKSQTLAGRDRERLETINEQAWHASKLIEQILDFSRQATLELHPLNLVPLLKEQIKLLKRTLPEHIRLTLVHDADEYNINADPTRMRQIITNLAVNGRDAMPDGGTLLFKLEQQTVTQKQFPALPQLTPGSWIKLSITDSGQGVLPDVLPHIFEPFFTTKGPGQGTGLGLAQVHGIVGQHNGHIDVKTQPGQGTTFTIFLPTLETTATRNPSLEIPSFIHGNGELLLIVEDEETLREALSASLKELNYRIVEAANGRLALALIAEQGENIDLVLSDVVMPEMGGKALFFALREQGWQKPVILLTGHPMDKEFSQLHHQGLTAWLSKPPDIERLAHELATALRE